MRFNMVTPELLSLTATWSIKYTNPITGRIEYPIENKLLDEIIRIITEDSYIFGTISEEADSKLYKLALMMKQYDVEAAIEALN